MAKVMVLGAGSFGTALALLCHRCGHEVTVWSHREEEANRLREEREQKKLLPGVKLPAADCLHCILAAGGSTGPVDSGSARPLQCARPPASFVRSCNQIRLWCVWQKVWSRKASMIFRQCSRRKSHSAPMWFCRDRPMPRRSAAQRRPQWWLPPRTRRQRARCRIG